MIIRVESKEQLDICLAIIHYVLSEYRGNVYYEKRKNYYS